MSESERKEIINNALEAGPTIPFPNFSKLFKSWLKILTTLSEEQRTGLFSAYIIEVSQSPQKLITFNLDGILEIFLTLEENEKEILSSTIKNIINNLNEEGKRKILIIIPDNGIVGPASNALFIISFLSDSDIKKNSTILFFKIGFLKKSGRLAKLIMIFPAKFSPTIDLKELLLDIKSCANTLA